MEYLARAMPATHGATLVERDLRARWGWWGPARPPHQTRSEIAFHLALLPSTQKIFASQQEIER